MSLASRARSAASLALLLPLAQLLAGCGDNISCVFTTGCSGGGGGAIAGLPATFPEDGQWILDSRPTIRKVSPEATDLPGTTPIVIEFSESMSPLSLTGAFEVAQIVGNAPGTAIPGIPQALEGDGRLLILLPQVQPLPAGAYIVRLAETAEVTDLTGQSLDATIGVQLGNFTVIDTPPSEPRVIATYPADAAGAQGDMGEIVVAFDRPIDAATVTDDSFQVTVDGGDPAEDPVAQPLTVDIQGLPTVDARVFTWRSVNASGMPVSLPASGVVQVTLSPLGSKIATPGGDLLPATTFVFTITSFTTPLSASIVSQPSDAIGLPNLTSGSGMELDVLVDLLDAADGDRLDLFMTGTSTSQTNPQLIALRRVMDLSGGGVITSASWGISDVDLTSSSDPTSTRLADGSISFAFRLTRNQAVSQLRLLDVDPATTGVQDPVLDSRAPTLVELTAPGGGVVDAFHSDQRNVVLTGVASEVVRSVEVEIFDGGGMSLGTNGVLPSVVGSRDDGSFVAAPVSAGGAGIVPGRTVDYTLTLYDAAFNASSQVSGTLEQRGVVGPGGYSPGDPITVEVYDATALAPLSGALVVVHGDLGDGIMYPLADSGTTGLDGRVTLTSSGAPSVAALVTVDLAGYDLFTFQGVTSSALSLRLFPVGFGASADVSGSVTSSDAFAALLLPSLERRLEDSRRPVEAPRLFDSPSCGGGFGFVSCAFGPEAVRPSRLGAGSFLAGTFVLPETSFTASTLLQAFCLELPYLAAADGGMQDTSLDLPFLLIDPTVDPSELPLELPAVTLDATFTTGIDTANLVGDPATTGDPRVTVEAVVPGIEGGVAVGMGLAYDLGGDMWTVRSAQAGAVSPGGFFGMNGAVETDLLLRCELRDTGGNVAGARPRVSALPGLPSPNTVFPVVVTGLVLPLPGSNTGGASFSLLIDNGIPDPAGEPGFYRVEVQDSVGRRWRLWRPDPPGVANVPVHFPDISTPGGTPLTDGLLDVAISSFAWPTLDPTAFLWTDVEREHDLYSHAATVQLFQP